jgi:hypothetical protein
MTYLSGDLDWLTILDAIKSAYFMLQQLFRLFADG